MAQRLKNSHLAVFKNKHKGETALYFGVGMTINDYKDTLEGVKIGSDHIIYSDIVMDYFFLADPSNKKLGFNKDTELYRNYKPGIAKMYRAKKDYVTGVPPGEDAIYYTITDRINTGMEFHIDITKGLAYGVTTSVDIMQIICYMGFSKVILIGHDVDYEKGSFANTNPKCSCKMIIDKWSQINDWMSNYYSNIEVYSLNPVNLKLFPEITYEELLCKKPA